jgi:translation initiation factor eIF-2B subunit gamma
MDLYPVVLAGGSGQGSGLYPLTEGCPKALLPVGNYPLIYYPLRLLERNKFQEVTVIVNRRDVKSISLAIDEYSHHPNSSIKCYLHEVPDSDEMGSANALSSLRSSNRIMSDLLVMSCDVISTILLDDLWELHTTQRSAVSMLLVPQPQSTDEASKKTHSNAIERDLIGMTNSGQMVFHSSLADVEDELKLTKKMLQRTPHFKMYSNLLDPHVYVISNWILDYIGEHLENMSSFKREVLPHLIKKQRETSGDLHDLAVSNSDSFEGWALSYSSFPVGTAPTPHPVTCHALTVSSGDLCFRANTVPFYIEANRMILQYFPTLQLEKTDHTGGGVGGPAKTSAVSSDSSVSVGVQLSDKSSIKRSMIGRHCIIEEKVKIINSIIMDHVYIGEG